MKAACTVFWVKIAGRVRGCLTHMLMFKNQVKLISVVHDPLVEEQSARVAALTVVPSRRAH